MRNASKAFGVIAMLCLSLSFGAASARAATDAAVTADQTEVSCSGMAALSSRGAIQGASQGGTATVNFTVASGCSVQLSLVSYKAPSATFSAATAHQQVLFDSSTGTFGAGAHTLSVDVPNCFFQIDFVFGQPLANLGPANSNNFYSAQGRLISAVNSGSASCVEQVRVETPPVTVVSAPTSTATAAVTTANVVIPAGPITWAPGFDSTGRITAPAGSTATSGGTQVAGTQTQPMTNLPSTSTEGAADDRTLLGLGVFVVGLLLLRNAGRSLAKSSRD